MPRGYNYRAEVRKLIPQLQVLDERPAMHTGLPASRKLDRDWLMVKEAIKEGSVLDSLRPRLGTAAAHLASSKGHPTPGLAISPSEPQEGSPPHGCPKTKALHRQPLTPRPCRNGWPHAVPLPCLNHSSWALHTCPPPASTPPWGRLSIRE